MRSQDMMQDLHMAEADTPGTGKTVFIINTGELA